MTYLILIRHGQSRWNKLNKFSGWVDIPLSTEGIKQAQKAAKYLKDLNLECAFTSNLTRAQETLLIILSKQNYTGIFLHKSKKRKGWSLQLDQLDEDEIPIFSSTALNERYYGDLQGQDKKKIADKFGKETVTKWRRSYEGKPPGGESLKDTYRRVVNYFNQVIRKHACSHNTIVSAHGNSLRALIKYLEKIPDDDIQNLEIPLAKPIIYKCVNGEFIREDKELDFNRKIYWSKY